jgi:hypothetical protein
MNLFAEINVAGSLRSVSNLDESLEPAGATIVGGDFRYDAQCIMHCDMIESHWFSRQLLALEFVVLALLVSYEMGDWF